MLKSKIFPMLILCVVSINIFASNPVELSGGKGTFLFIDDLQSNNKFITPTSPRDPRLTGANRWTSLKHTNQVSLAYADNGSNMPASWPDPQIYYFIDMWEENSPINTPYNTQRCIYSYPNCEPESATAVEKPKLIDSKGFYGLRTNVGWAHGEISDSFFEYLKNMPLGETLTREMHYCRLLNKSYDPNAGERCKDQPGSEWFKATVEHTKSSQLQIKRTDSIIDLMVDSAGNPIVLPGSQGCEVGVANTVNGVICSFLAYDFQHLSGSIAPIALKVMNKGAGLSVSPFDIQMSINKEIWFLHDHFANIGFLLDHNEIFIFISNNTLKDIVKLNEGSTNVSELFSFLFYHTEMPESGYYEISGTSNINIYPREYSVTITPSEGISLPYRQGQVGRDVLEFGYDIVKSAPVPSSIFEVSVHQDIPGTWGDGYCLFYPTDVQDKSRAVPVPAYISFAQQVGIFKERVNCDGGIVSLKDRILESQAPIISPDPSGDDIYTRFYYLNLLFDLTDPATEYTTNGSEWEGSVHQSGKIKIKAVWNE